MAEENEGTMVIGGEDCVLTGIVDSRAPGLIRKMLDYYWKETGCVCSVEKQPHTWLFDPKPEFWRVPTELFVYESPKAMKEEDLARQIHVLISREQVTLVIPEGRTDLRVLVGNIFASLTGEGFIKPRIEEPLTSLHGSAKHHLERFIKFLKTDNIDGHTTGGALYNLNSTELQELYLKWLAAGESEDGLGVQAG